MRRLPPILRLAAAAAAAAVAAYGASPYNPPPLQYVRRNDRSYEVGGGGGRTRPSARSRARLPLGTAAGIPIPPPRRGGGRGVGPRGVLLASSSSSSSLSPSYRPRRRFGRKARGEAETLTPQPAPEEEEEIDGGEDGDEPSLDEMFSSLGPVGRTVVGAVEVGLITVTSFLSGGALGYVGGGIVGLPALFRSAADLPPGSAQRGMRVVRPPPPSGGKGALGNFFREAGGRIGNWNGRAMSTGRTWGELSAAFSGFHALARVVRGNREDRWNGIIGSACAGAYMSRRGGPNAMMQGAVTYASFTYLLDTFFGVGGGNKGGGRGRRLPDGTIIDDRFEFKDEPVY